jgi:DUF4097 and DUF4098 domain-containing protein YvlB
MKGRMNKMKKNQILWVFISMLMLTDLVFAAKVVETFKKQIDFISNGYISILNTNGFIEVEGWNKNIVLIEAEKIVNASNSRRAESLLKEIEIEISHKNDEIVIETHLPKNKPSGLMDWIFSGNNSASVQYKIYVPTGANLDMKTTNGNITVANIEGRLNFKTTNGKIKGEDLSGRVDAHTTNGSIMINFNEIFSNNDMGFYTTNGTIKVSLPDDINCNIQAKTTNGTLNTEFPLLINGKHHSKRIAGEINGGGALLEFVTTNGSIHINKNK